MASAAKTRATCGWLHAAADRCGPLVERAIALRSGNWIPPVFAMILIGLALTVDSLSTGLGWSLRPRKKW